MVRVRVADKAWGQARRDYPTQDPPHPMDHNLIREATIIREVMFPRERTFTKAIFTREDTRDGPLSQLDPRDIYKEEEGEVVMDINKEVIKEVNKEFIKEVIKDPDPDQRTHTSQTPRVVHRPSDL